MLSCTHFYFALLTFAFPIFQKKYLIDGSLYRVVAASSTIITECYLFKESFPFVHEGGQRLARASPVERNSLVVDNLGPPATE